jgi:hypothetical protein
MFTRARAKPQHFFVNERGNTSILFGLLILPLVFVLGLAMDMHRAYQAMSIMQAAADSAVIGGGALPLNTTTDHRIAVAKALFTKNTAAGGLNGLNPSVSVSGNNVSLQVSWSLPTTFMSLAGVHSMPVGVHSAGLVQYPTSGGGGGPICMLALDPNSTIGIHVQGNNNINYPNCWGWSDSTQSTSVNGVGAATVVGAGTCAVGGVSQNGQYTPTPVSGCTTVADPYAGVSAYAKTGSYTPTFTPPTMPTSCMATGLTLKKGTYTLAPGRYCGGLSIMAGATVDLCTKTPLPAACNGQTGGVYIIDSGTLNVQSKGSLTGSNVLFYLANSSLTIIGGGTVSLTGRAASSSYPSFLVIADTATGSSGTSNIQGGGTFNMNGMVYMPTATIEVAGSGDVNDGSTYFGMIARDFNFKGNGQFNLAAKGSTGTLTDIMPTVPVTTNPSKVRLTQ